MSYSAAGVGRGPTPTDSAEPLTPSRRLTRVVVPTALTVAGIATIALAVAGANRIPTWLVGTMMVLGAIVLADAGLSVAHRLFPHDTAEAHANLLGATLGIVGTLYAIVVGFGVIVVWESMADTNTTISSEANALGGLERLSRGFPVEVQRQVQEATRTYALVVVDHEWETMRTGQPSELADAALIEIWGVYTDIAAQYGSTNLYSESLDRLAELDSSRRQRLLSADESVPPLMWALMYSGGLVTLLLVFAFGTSRGWRLRMIIGLLAATIAFALFLVAVLEGPFQGDMRADPSPFVFVLDNIPSAR